MWTFPYYTPNQPLDWALLEQTFSWLDDMRHVPQDPIWHAEGDVLTHTKMVVDALLHLPEFQALDLQNQHIVLMAALLHDVEKRSTTREEMINGQTWIVSPNHAKKGEHTTRYLLYTVFDAPFAVREHIAKLVRLHGLPLWAISKPYPEKAVISASLSVNTQLLAMLAKADVLGRECADKEDILLRIDLFEALCRELNCWGVAREFVSDYGRFWYLNHENSSPDYVPFDDLQFDVYMMCAVAGSGKDFFIQKHLSHLPMLSIDAIRREHGFDPADKGDNGRAVQFAKEQAKVYLREKRGFVFNATNISRDLRGKWLDLFHQYGARVHIVYLEVPYRQLLAQNRNREYVVPEKVLEQMLWKLDVPDVSEAFSVRYDVT